MKEEQGGSVTGSEEERGAKLGGAAPMVPSTQPTAGAAAIVHHTAHAPMTGSTPVHTSTRYSYLSSERMWYEKYTGLYNLCAVILVATNFR